MLLVVSFFVILQDLIVAGPAKEQGAGSKQRREEFGFDIKRKATVSAFLHSLLLS